MHCSKIHKLINYIWKEEVLPLQWKESIIVVFIKWVIKLTVVIKEHYCCYQLHIISYSIFLSQD